MLGLPGQTVAGAADSEVQVAGVESRVEGFLQALVLLSPTSESGAGTKNTGYINIILHLLTFKIQNRFKIVSGCYVITKSKCHLEKKLHILGLSGKDLTIILPGDILQTIPA